MANTQATSSALLFLKDELRRRDGGQTPAEVQTHISIVLLGATLAWKVKKAQKLPYLDFSMPQQRLALSERELELNRRTAPGIYRRVLRVMRLGGNLQLDSSHPAPPHEAPDADRLHAGRLQADQEAELVEAVLEMQRFDERDLLDRMALRDEITPALVTRLAHVVADFHGRTPPSARLDRTGSQRIGDILRINEKALEAARQLDPDAPVEYLVEAIGHRWQKYSVLLDERQCSGHVRRCHGDLHLRNIVVIDGVPTLFDCLEFNDDMATIDVLYDLGFVLMDLWHRGLDRQANLLLNRYLDNVDESAGLPLLGLFMSMRATVRGHVEATRALEMSPDGPEHLETVAQSQSYLDLALRLLREPPARLVAIGGLSGSGKSTAAAALAASIGVAPGARVLSSDRVRKALHGVAPETRLDREAYLPEVSSRVYQALRDGAAATLATGHSVLVDAVFDRPDERAAIEEVARSSGVAFQGVWLEAPTALLLDRVAARRGDPSDADVEVVRRQSASDVGNLTWLRLPATASDADWSRLRAVLG